MSYYGLRELKLAKLTICPTLATFLAKIGQVTNFTKFSTHKLKVTQELTAVA